MSAARDRPPGTRTVFDADALGITTVLTLVFVLLAEFNVPWLLIPFGLFVRFAAPGYGAAALLFGRRALSSLAMNIALIAGPSVLINVVAGTCSSCSGSPRGPRDRGRGPVHGRDRGPVPTAPGGAARAADPPAPDHVRASRLLPAPTRGGVRAFRGDPRDIRHDRLPVDRPVRGQFGPEPRGRGPGWHHRHPPYDRGGQLYDLSHGGGREQRLRPVAGTLGELDPGGAEGDEPRGRSVDEADPPRTDCDELRGPCLERRCALGRGISFRRSTSGDYRLLFSRSATGSSAALRSAALSNLIS